MQSHFSTFCFIVILRSFLILLVMLKAIVISSEGYFRKLRTDQVLLKTAVNDITIYIIYKFKRRYFTVIITSGFICFDCFQVALGAHSRCDDVIPNTLSLHTHAQILTSVSKLKPDVKDPTWMAKVSLLVCSG